MEVIRPQLELALKNRHIASMYGKLGISPESIDRLDDVPFVPVQMFKSFDLAICEKSEIFRLLKSSGTTGGSQSIVPLNKRTSSNQTKALKSIMQSFMGPKRRRMLVIDHEGINAPNAELTARGAGVRGLSLFSKGMHYLLRQEGSDLSLNKDAIAAISSRNDDAYIFGFTYIIWSEFYHRAKDAGLRLELPNSVIFHSGGWKKMEDRKVSREVFSSSIAEIFGTSPSKVHDFYGMAEQTGVIFVECEYGHKHVPDFAQVIIRDLRTLRPCGIGEGGLIQVSSPLADSYYSQAILTEDKGMLLGIDDCPCGRKGRYFQVSGRVARSEVRGCGDTYREAR
jgi:phenylacetate-coenzyme A ligase PaaK-like adenylate-forming protein